MASIYYSEGVRPNLELILTCEAEKMCSAVPTLQLEHDMHIN